MDFSEGIGYVLGTGVVSTGGAYYLFKRFMDIQVQQTIDGHKAELDKKVAGLKTDLDIYAHERTIGLTRLDELRASAIQELYALAIQWQELFLDITQPHLPVSPVVGQQLQRLVNWSQNLALVGDSLSVKVRDTAIYFDEESYNVIATYGQAATDLGLDFRAATFDKWDLTKEQIMGDVQATFDEARTILRDAYKGEFKQASGALIREFRRLLKADRVPKPV